MQIQKNNLFFGRYVNFNESKIGEELGQKAYKKVRDALPGPEGLWEMFNGNKPDLDIDTKLDNENAANDALILTVKEPVVYHPEEITVSKPENNLKSKLGRLNPWHKKEKGSDKNSSNAATEKQSLEIKGKTPVKISIKKCDLSKEGIIKEANGAKRIFDRINNFDGIDEEMEKLRNALERHGNAINVDENIKILGTPVVNDVVKAINEINELPKGVHVNIKPNSYRNRSLDQTVRYLDIIAEREENVDNEATKSSRKPTSAQISSFVNASYFSYKSLIDDINKVAGNLVGCK